MTGTTSYRRRARQASWCAAGLILLGALGCGATDESKLPPDVQDPATLRTPTGAVARYLGAIGRLASAFDFVMTKSGILTDELADLPTPAFVISNYTSIDSRDQLDGFNDDYDRLNDLRAQAREARGFVQAYAPDSSAALAGHMYAVEGYAEIFLADLFCSGIPLSTVDFNGDYTLAPGSTTGDVYRHAVALFDSALALTGDSVRLQQFAAVGRGRALLALGDYAGAAAAVSGVPDNYKYQIVFYSSASEGGVHRLMSDFASLLNGAPATPSVADREGTNGLDYLSAGDPRVTAVDVGTDRFGNHLQLPGKYYPFFGHVTLTIADGVEARLIQAEAALQTGDVSTWLSMLNQLRTGGEMTAPADTITDTLGVTGCLPYPDYCGGPNGPSGTTPDRGQPANFPPAGYSVADSFKIAVTPEIQNTCYNNSWYTPCWPGGDSTTVIVYVAPEHIDAVPGTGGVAGLDALTDPGTPGGRVDLMFRERAFWLYMTAHREGDLRRLIRQYGRPPSAVFPTGTYVGGSGSYGDEIVAPVPASERELNPKYTGCFHFNA